MTTIVLSKNIYSIICDIEYELEEVYGCSCLDDMYDIPRHDSRLVDSVKKYIKNNPNQEIYELVNIENSRYMIHIDVNGYETLYTDDSPKWIDTVI